MASVNSLRAKSIFGDSAASQVWRDGDTYQLWGLGLAGRFSDSLIEFDHQDATGSINMTTASNGVINGNLEMDAYGDLESATGNLQWGQTPYRYIGGLNCQSEALAAFGGGTSGGDSYRLVLMGERWYDPQAGRFISRDPVFSENLYAYCGNDPINSVDPEGRVLEDVNDVADKMKSPYKYKGTIVKGYEYHGDNGDTWFITHQGLEIEISGQTYDIGFCGDSSAFGGVVSLTNGYYTGIEKKKELWRTLDPSEIQNIGGFIDRTAKDPPYYIFPFYTCVNWLFEARHFNKPAPVGYIPPGMWGINGPLPDGYRLLPYPYSRPM